jgi:hypothetical protein
MTCTVAYPTQPNQPTIPVTNLFTEYFDIYSARFQADTQRQVSGLSLGRLRKV